jgi:hypothetical protein
MGGSEDYSGSPHYPKIGQLVIVQRSAIKISASDIIGETVTISDNERDTCYGRAFQVTTREGKKWLLRREDFILQEQDRDSREMEARLQAARKAVQRERQQQIDAHEELEQRSKNGM